MGAAGKPVVVGLHLTENLIHAVNGCLTVHARAQK